MVIRNRNLPGSPEARKEKTEAYLGKSTAGMQGKGVREGEVREKKETGTLQEQITFNEARRGSSQIRELLH